MTYLRAVDPFPLQAPEHTKLHEFYERLAEGQLVTTRCTACGHTAWPPRGFCAECGSDQHGWVELPTEGILHAFTVQETGLPAGFDAPRVFAIVKVGGHRVFAVVIGGDPARLRSGRRLRLCPIEVAPDPKGARRWLPAFTPITVATSGT